VRNNYLVTRSCRINSTNPNDRYSEFMKLNSIRVQPNFRWCSNPDCKFGQVHYGGDSQPQMTCKECSFLTCFTHQRPWHKGQTCKEFDENLDPQQKKQEAASKDYVGRTSALCPSCSAPVTKISGCSNVKCEYCLWRAELLLI